MADLATLKTRLAEAEAAYHQLALGAKEVNVKYDTYSVTYSNADMKKLKTYIRELESQIAKAEGRSTRRRILPVFSDE